MTISRESAGRLGAGVLAAAGVLFVLYPALRPWHDETTATGAIASMGSGAWVASHGFAMLGFVLVGLGLLSLLVAVGGARPSLAAVIVFWLGVGLTLPFYGAETFGLHGIARQAADGEPVDVLAMVDAVRFQPVAVTTFGVGLILLAIGAVLAAVAVWRSTSLPRHSAVLFALGFGLFLPQFYTPAAVRIGHGVLLGIGLLWLAVALARSAPGRGRLGQPGGAT